MSREEQRAKAAHEYIQSDSVAAGNEVLAFGDFIEGAKWADFHPQWIPVEEELPPKRKNSLILSDNVLIRITGGDYLSAVYNHQDKEWIDVYNIETLESNKVTHWMPIVPPRKEG